MDPRRRSTKKPLAPPLSNLHRHSAAGHRQEDDSQRRASDALPLPLQLTNALFLVLFFSAVYFLLRRWSDKIRTQTPLHVLTFSEILALLAFLASFVYLLGFFGIQFVQSFLLRPDDDEIVAVDGGFAAACPQSLNCAIPAAATPDLAAAPIELLLPQNDEELVQSVVSGAVPSYSLESKLGDCKRAAAIRREALQRITGRSLSGLPLEGFDYDSILGQCCEMPVGYVQIPVGIAGPLLLDGTEYSVPMATTEGCLVASTNRGCKAIHLSGGATSVLLRDGMTRAPVVRFPNIARAAQLKFYLEDPRNFDTVSMVFNRSSRFARLQSANCTLSGRSVYIRFCCSTGDAMGMNMVSKGVQNVLDFLQDADFFPDIKMKSGNLCADKKPAAVNWIHGRGKSVVCEAVIRGDVVNKVLKTSVQSLVELNKDKNLVGSAMAGALGGFNAHASNIVSAVYLATGQDPAQNVESSHCITLMESTNEGRDLHVSVTMPCIEVGTVGGGTQLASQAACLNLLGVKGACYEAPGANARRLATVVAGSVLAGELSLMSALAAGQLVKSHMKYNRSSKDVTTHNAAAAAAASS
ncbi:unnamed protein product [Linum tenue]|uniref:3-hydroxy-3-methylglutaryl coenzyme A reductase n=2 Tax=Linum tenue TaxID=586396 RepID=A0AAV0JBP7_9ROSI|nr:unnamed protein product [Linum tenue]